MVKPTSSATILLRAVVILGAGAASIASPAYGQTQAQTAAPAKPIRAFFACDAGKSADAAFINGPQSSVELTLSDGRKLSLPQAMSGSGARYANGDESIVFWNKGNTAFLEENGKTTYSGCVTKP